MSLFSFFKVQSTNLERRIGYTFKNRSLFHQSLTHKSYAKESSSSNDNERLEFLGDSILGMILSYLLMEKNPHYNEGKLSKVRSSLVSTKGLHKIAVKIGLGRELKLGIVEKSNQGVRNPRLLASAFEALIGAMYIDGGYSKVYKVISNVFADELSSKWIDEDYKTMLQKASQRKYQEVPIYEVIDELGPSHKKSFLISATLNGEELGKGRGYSKKEAEQEAAFIALKNIRLNKKRVSETE